MIRGAGRLNKPADVVADGRNLMVDEFQAAECPTLDRDEHQRREAEFNALYFGWPPEMVDGYGHGV